MIGIVLAGGSGTRLYPLTKATSKQLLPVYDKPMIYYPIATLMLASIREIIIISTPQDHASYLRLLGNGSQFGLKFHHLIQERPKGLADAFLVAKDLIRNKKTALILGDNIFHGTSLGSHLSQFGQISGAAIFGYRVANPEEYGVVVLDKNQNPIQIVEKPETFLSNIAIPGLYFYDESVLDKAKFVKPSARGELEIASINNMYLSEGALSLKLLPRGTAWLDTGTFENLQEAASYVKILQERQGYKISCLEEIAARKKWISTKELREIATKTPNLEDRAYLNLIAEELDLSGSMDRD